MCIEDNTWDQQDGFLCKSNGMALGVNTMDFPADGPIGGNNGGYRVTGRLQPCYFPPNSL